MNSVIQTMHLHDKLSGMVAWEKLRESYFQGSNLSHYFFTLKIILSVWGTNEHWVF